MTDLILDAVSKYGATVVGLIFSAIIGILGRAVSKHVWLRGFFERLGLEAKDVVMEVAQTYVDAIRAARADGILTAAERAEAKAQSIAKLKSNLGPKLLERARRVLGADDAGMDRLLETKVEAQVQRLKLIKSGQLAPVDGPAATSTPAPGAPMSSKR